VFRFGPFCGMAWSRRHTYGDAQPWKSNHTGMWFRVFGYGLHISTRKRADALFSERYGYHKALYLFGLRVEALKP
jgi:hypothetical protein